MTVMYMQMSIGEGGGAKTLPKSVVAIERWVFSSLVQRGSDVFGSNISGGRRFASGFLPQTRRGFLVSWKAAVSYADAPGARIIVC